MEQLLELRIVNVDALDRWQHDATAELRACCAELPEADTPAIADAIYGIDGWRKGGC